MKNILVTQSSMPEFDEYINEIKELWNSKWLTNMGIKHKMFQKQLKEYLGVSNVELFTNGHMALELSLQALDLKGEVITTPFTFASTTHAIVRNGLKPVFCDINEDDYTIDANKIEDLITEKTTAIVPVHVYGNICDIEEIERIAKRYSLKVIYDAAHTFGIKYKNRGIGEYGDISCFSFHATKVFHSVEGGAACYKDPLIGEKLYELKNFGIKGPEEVSGIGANAKMNEFCAAMGICNLKHIDEEIEKRKSVADRYDDNLKGIRGIRINKAEQDVESNYAYYPILIDEKKFGATRNDVFNNLSKNGIGARKYFYPLSSDYNCYKTNYDSNNTPIAKYISDRIITLPFYSDLDFEDIDYICSIIRECAR